MNETRKAEPARQKPIVLVVDPTAKMRNFYSLQLSPHFEISLASHIGGADLYFVNHGSGIAAIVVGADENSNQTSALEFIKRVRNGGYKKLIIGASGYPTPREMFRAERGCTTAVPPGKVLGILHGYLFSGAEHAPLTNNRQQLTQTPPPA